MTTPTRLLWWIITNLLTDSQLDAIPPGWGRKSLRQWRPEEMG